MTHVIREGFMQVDIENGSKGISLENLYIVIK